MHKKFSKIIWEKNVASSLITFNLFIWTRASSYIILLEALKWLLVEYSQLDGMVSRHNIPSHRVEPS